MRGFIAKLHSLETAAQYLNKCLLNNFLAISFSASTVSKVAKHDLAELANLRPDPQELSRSISRTRRKHQEIDYENCISLPSTETDTGCLRR